MEWFDIITQLRDMIGRALWFDPTVYDTAIMDDRTRFVSTMVVFLAGVSLLLGQCFALFLVAASPIGFVLGLIFSGLSLTVRLGLWMTCSVFFAAILFGVVAAPWNFISVIFVATAPLVFGFLAVLPSIGIIISYILYGWTCLTMMYGLFYGAQVPFLPGAACMLAGWIAVSLLERLFFTRSRAAKSGGFLFASRQLSRFTSDQVLDFVKQRVRPK
ncbi:hypothetical protein [Hoeflea sp. TYP-13]|uniref:hypothetical protein n=1 Tax=Hoeflea sp. TYP-13 TaxID=3230023 RepID=UPI0034C650DE